MKSLNPQHSALKNKGHTIFLKQVKPPKAVSRLLQPASTNKKLGDGAKVITKGKWKDFPMYQLSLEERRTCPKSCNQWATCYGNNMPFANRVDHEAKDFLSTLESELAMLSWQHFAGFVVRLHVLGDFYSAAYVRFWQRMLKELPNLKIFGYTHRASTSPEGTEIRELNRLGAWIRWSDAGGPMSANTHSVKGDIICPEQTGKTKSCMTCGLCWSVSAPIRFLMH